MSSGLGEWEKGIPCTLPGNGSPSGGDRPGLGSASWSCLAFWPPGPAYSELSSPGCGPPVGSGGPCVQRLSQPWLTRVRARPCYPPSQDARPHNCLQLQTAPALSPGFQQEPEPKPLPWGVKGATQPYCKVWGLPVAFGHFQSPQPTGLSQIAALGLLWGCIRPGPVAHPPSLSPIRMKLL